MPIFYYIVSEIIYLGEQKRKVSKFKSWKIYTHQNMVYAAGFDKNEFAIFKYDETQEHQINPNSSKHISGISVDFWSNFCVMQEFIVRIREDQPQLYFFSLEGEFIKTETMTFLKDKMLIYSYNENSMIVRDCDQNELWVVNLNGEATKINIDAEDPRFACVVEESLFVYCDKKKAIIKYYSK